MQSEIYCRHLEGAFRDAYQFIGKTSAPSFQKMLVASESKLEGVEEFNRRVSGRRIGLK